MFSQLIKRVTDWANTPKPPIEVGRGYMQDRYKETKEAIDQVVTTMRDRKVEPVSFDIRVPSCEAVGQWPIEHVRAWPVGWIYLVGYDDETAKACLYRKKYADKPPGWENDNPTYRVATKTIYSKREYDRLIGQLQRWLPVQPKRRS